MQLISKFSKGFSFFLCFIYIYSKYARIVFLKDKKHITLTNTFQILLDESNRKQYKICVDKGFEFDNRSLKSWLQDNGIRVYLAHNEGKSVLLNGLLES